MTATTFKLDNLTDAQIQNLMTEQIQKMRKAYKAGNVLTGRRFYNNAIQLSKSLNDR